MSQSVRIDKWLWAARFFRTRSMAAAAISNGKIEVDGVRPKPARGVSPGSVVTVRKGVYEYELEVLAVTDKRRSAELAQALYQETEDSVAKRAEVSESLRVERASAPQYEGKGRPTKRDRRMLTKIKRY